MGVEAKDESKKNPRYVADGFAWSDALHAHGAEKHLAKTKDKMIRFMGGMQ